MSKAPEIGSVQIGEAAEYGYKHGYVIEQYGIYGWAVPDWEERGFPELVGPFNTRHQAYDAFKHRVERYPRHYDSRGYCDNPGRGY